MRAILNIGWDGAAIWKGVLACLILAAITYALAATALRVRTRRQ
jgi:hypothetical protein